MDLRYLLGLLIPPAIILLIDYYAFQAFKAAFQDTSYRRVIFILYWSVTAFTIFTVSSIAISRLLGYRFFPKGISAFIFAFVLINIVSKLIIIVFLLGEDIIRAIRWIISRFSAPTPESTNGITRGEFVNRLAILTAAIPFGTFIYGMVVNAYNYQYRKVAIRFPNLPDAFNGFRIIQLSDIHSGSFSKTEPQKEAVEHINSMNADIILFTGDLVNNIADEMDDYINIFGKLRAKYGVLSTTGNHDYGDYTHWDSMADKRANFEKFMQVHKTMGWDLLMNEHRILEKDGQQIAIIGIENWGGGHFKKYGRMDKAYPGTENIPFKILMSHDPSHWDAQVRPEYPDIDLMLSGHTHGAQFGVESKWLRWSPSQYFYKQWAGLYQQGKQYLYVNRGFGFLGYPGRVGILPEVTEITLLKA